MIDKKEEIKKIKLAIFFAKVMIALLIATMAFNIFIQKYVLIGLNVATIVLLVSNISMLTKTKRKLED
jgi:Na+/H+ antiporter NhaD/arsenite permease-like protein